LLTTIAPTAKVDNGFKFVFHGRCALNGPKPIT